MAFAGVGAGLLSLLAVRAVIKRNAKTKPTKDPHLDTHLVKFLESSAWPEHTKAVRDYIVASYCHLLKLEGLRTVELKQELEARKIVDATLFAINSLQKQLRTKQVVITHVDDDFDELKKAIDNILSNISRACRIV